MAIKKLARSKKGHAGKVRKHWPALVRKRARHDAVPLAPLPKGYSKLLEDLKTRIRATQVKAALSVNRELIALYWQIGLQIVARQKQNGWGAGVIERLAKDLRSAFPDMSGFSSRNIWRMRAFHLAYTKETSILPQPVAELDGVNLPQAVAEIPWGHNLILICQNWRSLPCP